jgi:hypothetical protein
VKINLKKASLQRIYEFGLRHGRMQGERSMIGGGCAMRGDNGLKCVVGAMIDDELARRCDADSSATDHVWSYPVSNVPEWHAIIGKNERKYKLLTAMQKAHDGATDDDEFLADFNASMANVAREFDLLYKDPGVTLRA